MKFKKDRLHHIIEFFSAHKIGTAVTACVIVLCIIATTATTLALNNRKSSTLKSEPTTVSSAYEESSEAEVSSVISEAENSEEAPVSSSVSSVADKPTVAPKPVTKPVVSNSAVSSTVANKNNTYNYNTNSDIDNNIFLDALIYTGYNIKKHRADGMMWKYILASQKRGMGYLSKIGYAGGSTGYETTGGKPDIKYFERRGLVCASYVTYVYFNYLPNVAGIDTSSLAKPTRSTSANDWYSATKQWVSKGQARKISFKASKTSSGFINFKPAEEIPIGSIIVFCDARNRSDYGSHVVVYAGYKNNYHWVTHVGNDNGPEFCAVERMHFGPDPQWPIAVITPTNIRMSALLEMNVKDNNGAPLSGVKVSIKNNKTGASLNLGTTPSNGVLKKEGLSYGNYTITYTIPEGYISDKTSQVVNLTTASNSKNTITITLNKKPIEPPATENDDTNPEQNGSSDADSEIGSNSENSSESSSVN